MFEVQKIAQLQALIAHNINSEVGNLKLLYKTRLMLEFSPWQGK
jgi:hypothetical protein